MIPNNFVLDSTLKDSLELIGKTFERLTCEKVAGYILEGVKTKRTCYLFNCSCGNQVIKRGKDVKSGKTKSCGCLFLETTQEKGLANRKNPTNEPAFLRYYKQYKSTAKRKGLEFSLEIPYFKRLTSDNCHYCGEPPSKAYGKNWKGYSLPYMCNGIDRKDNEIGYTKENSLSCCTICNHAKHTLSYDYFIKKCKTIASMHNK